MRWFKRKGNKHKAKQQNVLDTKASRRQARAQRARVIFYGASATLGVLFALYIAWRSGEWLLNAWVTGSRSYAVRVLDIQTDGVISTEQLRRWSGVREGDNLFRLDIAGIKRNLELVPAIQSVAIQRVLPSTLKIHIQEREPVARVSTTVIKPGTTAQSATVLLDADAHVMMPLEPLQRSVPPSASETYPLITGVNMAALSPGKKVELPQVRAAMRLITAFEHSPMAGLVELETVDVSSPDVLTIRTDQQSEISLGINDLERQLNRWRLIYDVGVQQGRQIGQLDLSVSENIPLRWMEAGTVMPPGPKNKRISPYKKKHV